MNFLKANKMISFILLVVLMVGYFYKNASIAKDFVFLTDIDPTIIENVRYYGVENFLGKPVPGYTKNRIICTQQAASQLKKVQEDLKNQGFQLVVYDGYRPQKAVDAFMRWSTDSSDQQAKEQYYPNVDKKDVFTLGYVAEKSGHSRGSTFDLTLIPLSQSLKPITITKRLLKNGEEIPFLDDNTVDMGSSFDLFHIVSHHDTALIDESALQMRNLLRAIMKKHNFKDYQEEWWHYTLENEPYPNTYFDFSF